VPAIRVKKPPSQSRLAPRIRVYHGEDVALGPGKIELLGLVAETGSLSEAARRMKMSYMKAWLMVQLMNKSFRKPLIKAGRGGSGGGGAELTATGQKVLELYQAMETCGLAAMEPAWGKLRRMLKEP
jgi:molybdate transport system regulatory protein